MYKRYPRLKYLLHLVLNEWLKKKKITEATCNVLNTDVLKDKFSNPVKSK